MTCYPDRPPAFQAHEDIRGSMQAEYRQGAADGGQASLPWRLSQNVIDSVRPAGAEFARNADSARQMNSDPWRYIRAQIVPFGRTGTSEDLQRGQVIALLLAVQGSGLRDRRRVRASAQ